MYDSGGAPCVKDDLLSLAICKPQIRRTARRGDRVYGFGGNNDFPPNRMIFMARITDRLAAGRYYELSEYADRPDAIYTRDVAGDLVLRDDAIFHVGVTDHVRRKDIGESPEWANANVLVSDEFRYFGHLADNEWRRKYPMLAAAVKNLGQGHLVRHGPEVEKQLDRLWMDAFKQHDRVQIGRPTLTAAESSGRVSGGCKK